MTDIPRLARRAADLRALHVPGDPVTFANVWDVATAKIVAATGAPALATSSIAVALTHGLEDNDTMPPDVAFGAVARIAAAVDIPVTADLEAGYRLPAEDLLRRLLDAGAVGCNIEDLDHHGPGVVVPLETQAARIRALREAADAAGVPVVINARIDLFHDRRDGSPGPHLPEAIERGRAYLAAGADCVYPIFLAEEAALRAMVESLEGRVNALSRPGAPSLEELRTIGVARVSAGGGLLRPALDAFREAAAAFAPRPS